VPFGTKDESPARASFFPGARMFMLYLDASGTVQQQDATLHYVLVGAAVHENSVVCLEQAYSGSEE
jgi:hypothetical protein